MSWTCPDCGHHIAADVPLPVFCICKIGKPQPVCKHRDLKPCQTSCGCGVVYRCKLLNKYCADSALAFPLYEINVVNEDGSKGQLLSKNYRSDSRTVSDEFQACDQCGKFCQEESH